MVCDTELLIALTEVITGAALAGGAASNAAARTALSSAIERPITRQSFHTDLMPVVTPITGFADFSVPVRAIISALGRPGNQAMIFR
jgi:hypothetical protein